MPVQINEVIIKAVVDNNAAADIPVASNEAASPGIPDFEIAALVLEIIKEKNER